MSKLSVFLSIVILYICCSSTCLGDSNSGASPLTSNIITSAVLSKNGRVIAPGTFRLIRLLRKGLASGNEDNLNTEDENYFKKRQSQKDVDDYGHMRFGKRNEPEKDFDDYGHMRFGK